LAHSQAQAATDSPFNLTSTDSINNFLEQ
jgi:hypothetical protein